MTEDTTLTARERLHIHLREARRTDRLPHRGSTVRGRAGRLGGPAADTPTGVSRLWESRASRTDSQSQLYAVAAARIPLTEQGAR